MAKQEQLMAIIEVDAALVLPYDLACKLFEFVCQATPVRYDWGSSSYKRVTEPNSLPKMRMFTVAEFATMQLNDD